MNPFLELDESPTRAGSGLVNRAAQTSGDSRNGGRANLRQLPVCRPRGRPYARAVSEEKQVDVAVVGGGPAGMAAARRRPRGGRVGRADRRVRRARRADLAAPLRRGRARPRRARCRRAARSVRRARRAPARGARRRVRLGRARARRAAAHGPAGARGPRARRRAGHRRLRPPGRLPGLDAPGRDDRRRRAGAGEGPGRRCPAAACCWPAPARSCCRSPRSSPPSGAEVVAVAEATRRRDWLRAGPRMAAHPGRLVEYARYRTKVRRIAWGHVIVRAEGDDRVRSATIAAAGPDWAPERPRAHLRGRRGLHRLRLPPVRRPRPRARLRAARRRRRPRRRHARRPCPACSSPARRPASAAPTSRWSRASWRATLRRRATPARGAGERRRPLPSNARDRRPRSAAPPAREARGLRGRSSPTSSTRARACSTLATPDTILCRCEDVTAGAVDAAVAGGATTMSALKIVTRCGQGPCQGRTCERLVARAAAGARALQRPGSDPADSARRPDGRRGRLLNPYAAASGREASRIIV